MKKIISIAIACGVAISLAGCANKPKSLYGWGPYQQEVYKRFKSEGSPDEQIASLEAGLQKMRAKDEAVPPGYHAHLGMLYAETGKEDQLVQQFEAEKKLFPESTAYMNFLLRKYQK